MIAKIGTVLFAKERVSKFKKLSNLTFFAGILLLILFPFLSDNIFIVEKQLKFSEGFNIFQNKEKFFENSRKFHEETSDWFKQILENSKLYTDYSKRENRKALYHQLLNKMLSNLNIVNKRVLINPIETNSYKEKINSLTIRSQRGDFSKAIILFFIYDNDKSPLENSFHLVFAFLKNFENKNFYNWMSKDLYINFISKDLFSNFPSNLVNFIKTDEIINESFPEFFINIDISNLGNSINQENSFNILLKINGFNSENIDMDYYKIFYDNFNKIINENNLNSKASIQTFESKFDFLSNQFFKNKINKIKYFIISYMNLLIDTTKIRDSEVFRTLSYHYSYIFHNILENYFNFNREINANDILISEGKFSILIKIEKNSPIIKREIKEFFVISQINNNMINFGFNIFCVFERVIKNLNKVEIDIFRGDNNYILSKNNKFQGTGFFILIPVLCVLRIFFEILDKIHIINDQENEIFDSLKKNEKVLIMNDSIEELEKFIKRNLITGKLLVYLGFQIFFVLFFCISFSFLDIININLIKNYIQVKNIFKSLSVYIHIHNEEEQNFKIIALLLLLALCNLTKIILTKILQKKNNYLEFSDNSLLLEEKDFQDVFSFSIKNIEAEINNIISLLYLGLNLFLIFFINYFVGLIYIVVLMLPEYILINLQNMLGFLFGDAYNKKTNIFYKLFRKALNLIIFCPIFLIIYFDKNNLLKDYLLKVILNESGLYTMLKFIFIDILIYYNLKLQTFFYF